MSFSSLSFPFSSSLSSSSAMYREERSKAYVQWKTRIANVSVLEKGRMRKGKEGRMKRALEIENASDLVVK